MWIEEGELISRIILLALSILAATTCTSKSEVPTTDIKIPLQSVELAEIDQLEEGLRLFAVENELLALENDRRQMMILNGGKPAITFWFLVEEGRHPAITATTVNQGGFLRVMVFAGGFDSEDQMNRIKELFLREFNR